MPLHDCTEKARLLPDYIHVESILQHLKQFEEIAKSHGGNRAVGPGHAATAEYVISKLQRHTTCEPYIQKFKAPIWSELAPPVVNIIHPWQDTLIPGVDGQWSPSWAFLALLHIIFLSVRVMRYGGKSAIIPPTPLHHIHKDVCNAQSYKMFPKSHIALVWKDADCDPYTIAKAAEDAGAAAVILYNPPEAKYLSNARVRIVEWTEGVRFDQSEPQIAPGSLR